jgi:Ca-activated chloride channel family protein
MMMKHSLGLSVGGAKDADNFYENISKGYLPKTSSITCEGLFYDHYFDMPTKSCNELFCPIFVTKISKNPFTGKNEHFLEVALNSNIDLSNFKRKKLNLVIVLDISGSMGSPFDRYYYDGNIKRESKSDKSKIEIAKKSIVNLLKHLNGDDRLGVVLFDNKAYRAKPLRDVKSTDMDAIKKHILELRERGGTNWSEGYKEAVKLFDSIEKSKDYENRIIFLTDAMPNRGELNSGGLFDLSKDAAKRGIFTTYIGVGVDFNTDLIEAVSKTKGANYYSIHSEEEFKKRLDNEFIYMVSPIVFDLKISFDSDSFKIEKIYGSTEAKLSTDELLRVNTLFASPTTDEGTRGGVILTKLKKIKDKENLSLKIGYKDRDGSHHQKRLDFRFEDSDDKSIKKAILLSRYCEVMQNFLIDMRASCNDRVSLPYTLILKNLEIDPKKRLVAIGSGNWERRSCKLRVSPGYQKLLNILKNYYQKEMKTLNDPSLQKELDLLNLLLKEKNDTGKIDDWESSR